MKEKAKQNREMKICLFLMVPKTFYPNVCQAGGFSNEFLAVLQTQFKRAALMVISEQAAE